MSRYCFTLLRSQGEQKSLTFSKLILCWKERERVKIIERGLAFILSAMETTRRLYRRVVVTNVT